MAPGVKLALCPERMSLFLEKAAAPRRLKHMHPPHSHLGIRKQIQSGRGCNKIIKYLLYLCLNANGQCGFNLLVEMEANCIWRFCSLLKTMLGFIR